MSILTGQEKIKMNLVYSVRYFFYIIRFFGIFPFEIIDKNHLKSTIRARLTIIIGIPGIFIGVLVYFYGFSATPKIKGGRFRALLLKLAFLTICTVYLSIVVLANATYTKQKLFYDNLMKINDDLMKQYQIEINHRKISRKSIILVGVTVVYYIGTMLIVIMYSHRIGNFVFIFAEECQRFQSSLCFITFNMCVHAISMQLMAFNRKNRKFMENNNKNRISIEYIFYLLNVHMKIKKNIKMLNSIYCSPLTIISSYYFYRVTSQLFGILDFFSDDGPHYLRPYMTFYQFLPTLWNVWILIMISYNCQEAMIKVDKYLF